MLVENIRSTGLPLAITRWVQATVHFPLTSALTNLSNINICSSEFFWQAGNQTQCCWVRSKYATSVLCSLTRLILYFWFLIDISTGSNDEKFFYEKPKITRNTKLLEQLSQLLATCSLHHRDKVKRATKSRP